VTQVFRLISLRQALSAKSSARTRSGAVEMRTFAGTQGVDDIVCEVLMVHGEGHSIHSRARDVWVTGATREALMRAAGLVHAHKIEGSPRPSLELEPSSSGFLRLCHRGTFAGV
jgi:hypothetical protein